MEEGGTGLTGGTSLLTNTQCSQAHPGQCCNKDLPYRVQKIDICPLTPEWSVCAVWKD